MDLYQYPLHTWMQSNQPTGIIAFFPCEGWLAVFVDTDRDHKEQYLTEPVIGWGLYADDAGKQSMVGITAGMGLTYAEQFRTFLRYIRENEEIPEELEEEAGQWILDNPDCLEDQ